MAGRPRDAEPTLMDLHLHDKVAVVTGGSRSRMSEPEAVARAIAFAASPNNITGAELLVDGGIIKHV